MAKTIWKQRKWLWIQKKKKEMITDKDAKEYHKLIKKLEEQNNKFKKEQDELDESYKQSKLNKKERDK